MLARSVLGLPKKIREIFSKWLYTAENKKLDQIKEA